MIITGIRRWPDWTFDINEDQTQVTITAPTDTKITRENWRQLPIGTALRQAQQAHITATITPPTDHHSFTADHLQAVADLYQSTPQAPRLLIATTYQVSTRTVDRWIKAARQAGILEPWKEK